MIKTKTEIAVVQPRDGEIDIFAEGGSDEDDLEEIANKTIHQPMD